MELAQEIQKIRFLKICGLQPTVLVSQQKSNLISLMKTSWFTYKLYTTKVSIIASKVHHQWFNFFIRGAGGGGLWPPNFWPTTLFSGFSHTTDRKVPSEVVLMGSFMSVIYGNVR